MLVQLRARFSLGSLQLLGVPENVRKVQLAHQHYVVDCVRRDEQYSQTDEDLYSRKLERVTRG